jgi:Tfp pilus assembly protein PilV
MLLFPIQAALGLAGAQAQVALFTSSACHSSMQLWLAAKPPAPL